MRGGARHATHVGLFNEAALNKPFDVKIRGRLGEGPTGMKEIRLLNRIIKITSEGLTYEADPRHVELLARSLGLVGTRYISTPGIKYNDAGTNKAEETVLEEEEDADKPVDAVNVVHDAPEMA